MKINFFPEGYIQAIKENKKEIHDESGAIISVAMFFTGVLVLVRAILGTI